MERIRNFTPAQANMSRDILKIAGTQVAYFRTDDFMELVKDNKKMLLDVIDCKDGGVIFLTASGSGAMDSTVSNIISDKDKVLVINGGTFGRKWCEICAFYNISYVSYDIELGKCIDFEKLEGFFRKDKFDVLLMQATETSTGQSFNVKEVGRLTKKYDVLLIVDAITAFAIDEYKMDSWNVDVSIISTQKGFHLFPGMSMVILGPNVLKKRKFLQRSYYFNYNSYLEDLKDLVFPCTPNVSILYQINHRLKEMKRKGMDKVVEETHRRAIHFRSLIKDLPVKIVAENPSNCSTSLDIETDDVKDFFKYLQTKNIYITPTKKNRMGIGHIGELSLKDNKVFYLELKKWLERKK